VGNIDFEWILLLEIQTICKNWVWKETLHVDGNSENVKK
jgi:hypothetical protein